MGRNQALLPSPISRRFTGRISASAALVLLLCGAVPTNAFGSSLRYFNNSVNDIDRVKIRIDDPADNNPGPPADVGDQDFTVEFWVQADSTNQNTFSCGSNNWILGNIVVDRDRFAQGREWGIALNGGRLAFGTMNEALQAHTICGSTDIRDGAWHHVAVQRRRSDGRMWLFVDGNPEAEADGPDGDISYPDDGVPDTRCGASQTLSCDFSDPFIVIGAEKHDAPGYVGFSGWLDELRLSTVLRYSGTFAPSSQAFVADSSTAGLYHFDEGSGDFIGDSAFNSLSPGERRFGGSPPGPQWVSESPFGGVNAPGTLRLSATDYSGTESGGSVDVVVWRVGGNDGAITVDYAVSGGTATSGVDYQATSGTLSWANGDATNKSFSIPIIDDSEIEGDETATITLSTPGGGATLGSPATAQFIISDDDQAVPGTIQFRDSAVSTSESSDTVVVAVSRSNGSTGAVTVDFSTSDESATAGADYTASSGTLSWADGDATIKTISIQLINDNTVENNETFRIDLSNATGGAVIGGRSSILVTINDDDSSVTPQPRSGGGQTGLNLLLLLTLFALMSSRRRHTARNDGRAVPAALSAWTGAGPQRPR